MLKKTINQSKKKKKKKGQTLNKVAYENIFDFRICVHCEQQNCRNPFIGKQVFNRKKIMESLRT